MDLLLAAFIGMAFAFSCSLIITSINAIRLSIINKNKHILTYMLFTVIMIVSIITGYITELTIYNANVNPAVWLHELVFTSVISYVLISNANNINAIRRNKMKKAVPFESENK